MNDIMRSPLLGFAPFTDKDGDGPIIVAIDEIALVEGSNIRLKGGFVFKVKESHEEILKRIGLPIAPRAETIMKP
jgi:hypothetical protein